MTRGITMEMLHDDLESLKRDFAEIKALLLEPKLKKEIVAQVKEARKRMGYAHVSNEDMRKEFGVSKTTSHRRMA